MINDKLDIISEEETSMSSRCIDNSINELPNTMYIKNPLVYLLEEYNLLSTQRIDAFLKEGLTFDKLISSYEINTDTLYSTLAKEFNTKLFSNENDLEKETDINQIDKNILKKLSVITLHKNIKRRENTQDKLYVVISNPYDYIKKDIICSLSKLPVVFEFAKEDLIKKVLAKKLKDSSIKFEFKAHLSQDEEMEILSKDVVQSIEYNEGDIEIPIIPLVNYIVLNAQKNSVSDIHIEPVRESTLIRYRIDGILQTESKFPSTIHKEIVSRIKILSDMNVAEKRLPQDGRFSILDENHNSLDIRVSTFPTVYGEKVVMRLLEQEALKPSLEDLHLNAHQLETITNKINSPYGLILITGPTGSGKTTTLYSALSTVDRNEKNVLTVEDPVEYKLDGVHQMQVNEKISLTFASGLRTILRQDPDVIMVGEIRDLETATMAIRASLTGHIVFSTLHTNDSIGVIIRLINMGIDPFLVASSVTLAIAQRLVRTICPNCIEKLNIQTVRNNLNQKGISDGKLKNLGIDLDNFTYLEYGKGCDNCRGTGYKGRRAVFEFFEPCSEISDEILKPSFNENDIREIAKQKGMKTLLDNSLELVVNGVTTIEELVRVIGDK